MDLTGSGIETISHLCEPGNGRITVMFNAFEGPPKIVRLWGNGKVLENGSSNFENFVTKHDVKTIPGTRSIILVDIHQVGTSCGFAVPFFDFKEFRPTLNDLWRNKAEKYATGNEEESMDRYVVTRLSCHVVVTLTNFRYWAYKNAWSIDGLPGMQRGQEVAKRDSVMPIKKIVGPLALRKYVGPYGGVQPKIVVLAAAVCFLLGCLFGFYVPLLSEYLDLKPWTQNQLFGWERISNV